jgi:hypothetical protein
MVNKFLTKHFAHKEVIRAEDKLNYLGNLKCHNNCLNYALKTDKVEKILGCVQVFEGGDLVAHFVVRLKDGSILDPTFGRLSSISYSYLIVIEEYNVNSFSPDRELTNLKLHLYNLLPWYLKIFTGRTSL